VSRAGPWILPIAAIGRRRVRAASLAAALMVLSLAAPGPPALHHHGTHDAAVYDDHCPLRVAGLGGVGLPAVAAPPAPRPLPTADRPIPPAWAGFVASSTRSLQPRAPPPPSSAA
jgi:hypothetical protein